MRDSLSRIPILIHFSFSVVRFGHNFLLSVTEIMYQHSSTGISAYVWFIEMNSCFTRSLRESRNMCVELHSPKCRALLEDVRKCLVTHGQRFCAFQGWAKVPLFCQSLKLAEELMYAYCSVNQLQLKKRDGCEQGRQLSLHQSKRKDALPSWIWR